MFDFAPLFTALVSDFEKFQKGPRSELSEFQQKQLEEYKKGLAAPDQKSKYIRIVKDHGTPSAAVWGFVVNTHNDPKFKYGDILKAAGWKAPAKNKARGSMFEPEKFKDFNWTSAS